MMTFSKFNEIYNLRLSCKCAACVLDFISNYVKPGITTSELDDICLEFIMNKIKANSATVGYCPFYYSPFTGSICTSINQKICHGIPDNTFLKVGDSLNIDVTIVLNNWYGDTSRMFHVGKQNICSLQLSKVSFECLWLGINEIKCGANIENIGYVIQKHAENNNFSVVREFCGHGIGKKFHKYPQVLHYFNDKEFNEVKLSSGMILTVEPIINLGNRSIKQLSDGWSVETKDSSLSAQWEHTVIVTNNGCEVLTNSYF